MDSRALLEYWAIVKSKLWLILLMLGLTLAVVVVRSLTAAPTYSASVLLLVSVPERDDITMYEQYSNRSPRDEATEAKNNFINMLRSETVAGKTVQSMALQLASPDLIESLSVETPAGTDFIVVSLKADSPEEAQKIVNAHVDNTLKYVGMLRSRPSTAMREFISKRLAGTTRELDAANNALRDFRSKNSIGNLDEDIRSRQSVITSLSLERDKASALGNGSQASAYDQAIRQREKEIRDLSPLAAEHDTMVARIAQLQDTYKFLLQKNTEASLKEEQASVVGHVQIVEWAAKPEQPAPQKTATFALMGGLGSIVAGLMLILVWEYGTRVVAQGRRPSQPELSLPLKKVLQPDEG